MQQKLYTSLLLLSLSLSHNVHAQKPAECIACEEALGAAGRAIDSLLKLTQEQDVLITGMKQDLISKQIYVEDLQAENRSWYRNPWITIPIGVGLGALGATYLITK